MWLRTLLAAMLLGGTAAADTALVAVAANYAVAAQAQVAAFGAASGHTLTLTTGSTGKLYVQAVAGAPFDLLLAADAATPARLEAEGLSVPGMRAPYALGRLMLWSPGDARASSDPVAALTDPGLRHLALANPALAPYGEAARQTLVALALWDRLQPRLVMGENVGQAYALVATGAAEAGFVAASAVPDVVEGGRWLVPEALHDPLRQDAVLLLHGAENAAAKAFFEWLQTPQAAAINAAFGYGSAP